jgi:hypothetical protein
VEGDFHGYAPLLVKMVSLQDTEPAGKTEEEIYLEWPAGTEAAEGISG